MTDSVPDAYFTTTDGQWFQPTGFSRGPWDADACHAGPPTALLVRALERVVPAQQLARVNVDLLRPVPMAGFRVQAEIERPGRSVTRATAEIFDDDRVYVRAHSLHLRTLDGFATTTVAIESPQFADAVPGPFPIQDMRHDLLGFNESIESRYDPAGSIGEGGPTIMWMRSKVPILADEEPSGFQRICPLGDSGNGISYNEYLDTVGFVNPDLQLTIHREPHGEWLCSRVLSHWHDDGIGMADAELFDASGPVGRAVQTMLLDPVRPAGSP